MTAWRICATILSGLLLSACFAPLEWDLLIWIALLPLLLLPVPHSWHQRLLVGYLWGYIQNAFSLLWLNNVGFGAGFLLSLYCALFPMAWYCFFSCLLCSLQNRTKDSTHPPAFIYLFHPLKAMAFAFILASAWVSLEWLRSWLFTGFPWNQLGISQYHRSGIIQIAAYTGVYGLSFLILLINLILCTECAQFLQRCLTHKRPFFPWHLTIGVLAFLPVCYLGTQPDCSAPEGTPELLLSAVQGNIPLCREWTQKDYVLARDVYTKLSEKEYQQKPAPDLIIWPESAVPASLNYPEYNTHLNMLLEKIPIPFLIGILSYRENPNDLEMPHVFNSALLLQNSTSDKQQYYDKIHRVPFGEYVPGSKYYPQLREWIGMGRDLTPGQNYTIFHLPKGALAGINICFEDVFPEISREFTLRGANLLMTITNDSWYRESAGAQQHLSHVVFRAVENRRPLLRSGNNSHTCLITPNGKILGIPENPDTGSRFFRCATRYQIPIYNNWGMTFYTKHGNLFAILCNIITLAVLAFLFVCFLHKKKQNYDTITK
ncbi:MAG: apolipoprotein N-acyltransferase [Lentisphaeria bacterium]